VINPDTDRAIKYDALTGCRRHRLALNEFARDRPAIDSVSDIPGPVTLLG